MRREVFLFSPLLLIFFIAPIAGCGDGECSQARIEERNLRTSYSNLETELSNLERELWNEYSEFCSNLPAKESLLDLPWDDIYCQSWIETGKPMNTVTINNEDIAILTDKVVAEKRRWAIAVTTYKECFEPAQVIPAKEILGG